LRYLRQFLQLVTRNPISLVGTSITTASAVIFVTLFAIELVGFHGGPYLGILAFLIIPAVFVFGLILIPIGAWREGRLERLAKERGEEPRRLPVIDLNSSRTRNVVVVFVGATVLNLMIVAVATYKGVEVMDSTEFCGTACHSVMQPEFTTYSRSPHARVACVSCHIGPGANWFVKSKLSGSWQLVSVAFNLYPRPIPAPVHNLRPARETCEQCHWPSKFVGDRLRVITHFAEDEANTELKTVLLMKVGGTRAQTGHGIHWHVDPSNQIRYRADASREVIYEVEMTQADGTIKRFMGPEPEADAVSGEASIWRTMDCVDCHNRPTHIYRLPEEELDLALDAGHIERTLPWVRREGLRVLKQDFPSHDVARREIQEQLERFYAEQHPEVVADRADEIRAAAKQIGDIYATNVFPSMNITWGTYATQIGHTNAPGCFRCHNDEHATPTGETIAQDCSMCHEVFAQEEEDPEVLRPFIS